MVQLANTEALRTNPHYRSDHETRTDAEGRFEFRLVPAGRYVMGVDLFDPRQQGTFDPRRARPLEP